jgi:hypothetical protein
MRVKCGIFFSLTGLVLVGAGSSGSGGTGDGNNDNDDPHHRRHREVGGLHWRDLGVSLVNCPWTTAQMLDKYDASSNRTTMDNGRTRQWQCMDDSTWLLHPSSGFVESGSLCGILGPRYAIHRRILFFAVLLCLFSGETYHAYGPYGCAVALAKPPCLTPSEEQLLVVQEYF